MSVLSASAKMEALGAIVEQLLIELERTEVLSADQADAVLTAAADSLIIKEALRTPTRENAQNYVKNLVDLVGKQRIERQEIASR